MSAEEQLGATMDVVAHDSLKLDEIHATLHFVVVPLLGRLSGQVAGIEAGVKAGFDAVDGRLSVIEQRQGLDHRLLVAIAEHLNVRPPEDGEPTP